MMELIIQMLSIWKEGWGVKCAKKKKEVRFEMVWKWKEKLVASKDGREFWNKERKKEKNGQWRLYRSNHFHLKALGGMWRDLGGRKEAALAFSCRLPLLMYATCAHKSETQVPPPFYPTWGQRMISTNRIKNPMNHFLLFWILVGNVLKNTSFNANSRAHAKE